MIDLWVQLTNSTSTGKLVCRKTNAGLTNFCLRVDNNVPTIEFQSPGGVRYAVSGVAIPANLWTHLTASWIPTYKSLELKQNDVTYQAQILASACAQGSGQVAIADTGLFGYLDKVMIRNPLPVDVAFVLDISGSMSGDRHRCAEAGGDPGDRPSSAGHADRNRGVFRRRHEPDPGVHHGQDQVEENHQRLVVKNLTDYTKAMNMRDQSGGRLFDAGPAPGDFHLRRRAESAGKRAFG